MEAERRTFQVFLAMHANKADVTEEPVAHLQFCNAQRQPPATNAPLIRFTRDDILACSALDHSSELVRFLLHQMTTYDSRTQRIVGLVFDKDVVLSDVLRLPPSGEAGTRS